MVPTGRKFHRVGVAHVLPSAKAADRWEPQEPVLARRSLFARAVLFGGLTPPRTVRKGNYAETRVRLGTNVHDGTTGRRNNAVELFAPPFQFHHAPSRHATAFSFV